MNINITIMLTNQQLYIRKIFYLYVIIKEINFKIEK